MHYRHITAKALELGWITTKGKSPEDTMNARIGDEITGKGSHGESPRFVRNGKGLVSLSKWAETGLIPFPAEYVPSRRPKRPLPPEKNGDSSSEISIRAQIEQYNAATRRDLLARLQAMRPDDFERLIGKLLKCQGYEEVEVTKRSGDKGIDVRGVFVVDMFRTHMAIQVKRWKQKVEAPIVRHLRGSLRPRDHGHIITTSDFSKGAKEEAKQSDRTPIQLMNGEELIFLLVKYAIGVRRVPYELIELTEPEEDEGF